jgi:hypothetical protein
VVSTQKKKWWQGLKQEVKGGSRRKEKGKEVVVQKMVGV